MSDNTYILRAELALLSADRTAHIIHNYRPCLQGLFNDPRESLDCWFLSKYISSPRERVADDRPPWYSGLVSSQGYLTEDHMPSGLNNKKLPHTDLESQGEVTEKGRAWRIF